MVYYFKMPKLTELMAAVKIGKWLKKEGDTLRMGEPICEVESEKATEELQSPESGILKKIVTPKGATVEYDELIAVITASGEEIPDLIQVARTVEKSAPIQGETAAAAAIVAPAAVESEAKVKISPVARKMAEEYKVDISKIKGSGPEGRIVREDILRTIEEAKNGPKVPVATIVAEETKTIQMSRFRQISAERLTHSVRTGVPATITVEVDMEEAVRLHDEAFPEIEKRTGCHLSYTDLLVASVSRALAESPVVNSRLEGDQLKVLNSINVGVAVSAEEGLVVPVIHNADKKSVTEISTTLKSLAEKARLGKLSISDGTGGTFTVSNLGMFGVDSFTPIINPPESAILGVGRIVRRPVVVDGNLEIRSRMMLSLVFDHRIMDGAQAAQFLGKIKSYVERPITLLLQ
jgi:pyruvate dehydrogenase E2 component (dihydrolipoamide acetyltransferase)